MNTPEPGAWPEIPQAVATASLYGSDAIAALLRRLDIRHLALNPGASYRGLHDSLVNYLGNRDPALLLCLHEESAVAIAHGYAKVTARPMGVVLHSNVGLMHASMAIFRGPLDYIGREGGGGVGAGPGITVGAALALKGTGRLPVGIVGDGDFLMGVTAVWTAVHYRLPCVMIIANNRAFYNDEMHQERVAQARGRPVENKWIGQRIADPDVDLAAMARAQGAAAFGPVSAPGDLRLALEQAITAAEQGAVGVVDVRVRPGYDANPSGPAAHQRH